MVPCPFFGGRHTRVLVAYGSAHGATAEIAQAIGEELRKAGMDVEVHPVEDVRELQPFDAVVLGSGVYTGAWKREALKFGKRHTEDLQARPVWLFESGPIDTSADEGKAVPAKGAAKLAQEIGARQHVVFGGQFGPEDVGGFTGRMIAMGGDKNPFGDFRNFDRIRAWARAIGEELARSRPIEAI